MENMDKGLTVKLSTKMGADKLFENTPNAPKVICPNCLPKPKSLGFWWKKIHWVSVVRVCDDDDAE